MFKGNKKITTAIPLNLILVPLSLTFNMFSTVILRYCYHNSFWANAFFLPHLVISGKQIFRCPEEGQKRNIAHKVGCWLWKWVVSWKFQTEKGSNSTRTTMPGEYVMVHVVVKFLKSFRLLEAVEICRNVMHKPFFK